MLTIKAMAGGVSYAEHHLSHNDYYSESETITGRWMGRGAEMLGLRGIEAQLQRIQTPPAPAIPEPVKREKQKGSKGAVGKKNEAANKIADQ
jgi:hypothetical protein